MARTKNNRDGRLEEAMALLLQNQATFVQSQTAFLARMAEIDAEIAKTNRLNSERFARIEAILLEHSRILADHTRVLADHTRILQALPETIRQKIGFKIPETRAE